MLSPISLHLHSPTQLTGARPRHSTPCCAARANTLESNHRDTKRVQHACYDLSCSKVLHSLVSALSACALSARPFPDFDGGVEDAEVLQVCVGHQHQEVWHDDDHCKSKEAPQARRRQVERARPSRIALFSASRRVSSRWTLQELQRLLSHVRAGSSISALLTPLNRCSAAAAPITSRPSCASTVSPLHAPSWRRL